LDGLGECGRKVLCLVQELPSEVSLGGFRLLLGVTQSGKPAPAARDACLPASFAVNRDLPHFLHMSDAVRHAFGAWRQ
jgi:hypothetical protein